MVIMCAVERRFSTRDAAECYGQMTTAKSATLTGAASNSGERPCELRIYAMPPPLHEHNHEHLL